MHTSLLMDLGISGLRPTDLSVREAGSPELAAVGIPRGTLGYVIPYYDILGDPISFYRVKLIDHDPKYKQPKNTPSHVYFPLKFHTTLYSLIKAYKKDPTSQKPYIIITEGEKKAAAGTAALFPTVGLGGVDSWRNRTLILPEDTTLEAGQGAKAKTVRARLPSSQSVVEEVATLAVGMTSLIDVISRYNLTLIIVFDTDADGIKVDVQRAAAQFGYELRHLGIPTLDVRQIVLPIKPEEKMGLDDYLIKYGPTKFQELLDECLSRRCAFPRHPNPRAFINTKLQRGRLTRKECQAVSLSVLTELDARGIRLKSKSASQPFYFDEDTRRLMSAALLQRYGPPLHESLFGRFLYKEFGIAAVDTKPMGWLAAQFTGEEPIGEVEPHKVLAQLQGQNVPDLLQDSIAYQISDSEYITINPDPNNPIQLHNNGTNNILFEQDHVESLDGKELLKEFDKQFNKKLKPWWKSVFDSVNVSLDGGDLNAKHTRDLATLLFYISPWLHHWRGTQLPVEIFTGEGGSGKSSLYQLRLSILTGRPVLRNVPTDLRDWHASVTNTGALHVIDNVQFVNKDLRQRLSDEICRIVTAPDPHVEMRKLYTTTDQARIPVRTVFAMTAIQQPFHNSDLIQRATIFNLEAIPGSHDGDWVKHQINKFGGRLSWVVHHLLVLHKFLDAVHNTGSWDSEYQATHRLAHYEQSLVIMSDVLSINTDWLAEYMSVASHEQLSDVDWAIEGLKVFREEHTKEYQARIDHGKEYTFTAADVASWAVMHEDYSGNSQLNNSRRLGKYMTAHKMAIRRTIGIKQLGIRGNRKIYTFVDD